MLAAAELAYAAAAAAEGPVRFEPVEVAEGEEPMFRPVAFAPVGGLEGEWQGVPLQVLASVLDRSRTPQSGDDEEYAASFVYVLFRLKAALGVWRGDGAPSARYRLWLKDMAAVIARHPRTGPKVVDCSRRVLAALTLEADTLTAAFEADRRLEETPLFQLFAPLFDQFVQLAKIDAGPCETLGCCLWRCGDGAEDRQDLGWALQVRGCLIRWYGYRASHSGSGRLWDQVANAYMNRGNSRQGAWGFGSRALEDYDQAVALREGLRGALEPVGGWGQSLRETLAKAYSNRGIARLGAAGYDALSAIEDHDRAIAIQEDLRRELEPRGAWHSSLRETLAGIYMNRGNARQSADGHGLDSAIQDYDRAVAIREDLRQNLERSNGWDAPLRETLAMTYMNRGIAKRSAPGYGPSPAIEDYDRAVAVQEDMRQLQELSGGWHPSLRETLANTYINRGVAKLSSADHGPWAAVQDLEMAIVIQEELRRTLEPAGSWDLPLREGLALARVNYSVVSATLGFLHRAMDAAVGARAIVSALIESVGEQASPPMWLSIRDAAESQIADLKRQL